MFFDKGSEEAEEKIRSKFEVFIFLSFKTTVCKPDAECNMPSPRGQMSHDLISVCSDGRGGRQRRVSCWSKATTLILNKRFDYSQHSNCI